MTAPRHGMPHRAVIDPNVFISALMAKPGSPNSTIAYAVTTGKLTLVACPALLQELSNAAHRERFRRWFSVEDSDRLVIAEMHPDPAMVPPVCAEPDDDYLFALADSAKARVIVSGDRKVQAVNVTGIAGPRPAAPAPRTRRTARSPSRRIEDD
ncbi:MAG: putative toxin-antitoxin system toxin component, PIN family [Pseudonocardiaceae bacterium]